MTHDELLAKIKWKKEDYYADDQSLNALRAVVELHKPRVYKKYQSEEIAYIECTECKEGEPISGVYYPCETIQAIEKELQ